MFSRGIEAELVVEQCRYYWQEVTKIRLTFIPPLKRWFSRSPSDKSNRGLSPIIAAVILLAIAILLAASLSGFASSFVAVYSGSPQISIRSMQIHDSGTGSIMFYNAGANSDSVLAVQVSPNSPVYPATDASNYGLGGNSGGGASGSNNNPGPNCTEHSDNANCLHDQGRGRSGNANSPQNNGNPGSSNNGGQNSGSSAAYDSAGVLLPPNSEQEVSWYDSSVGQFYSGQTITVHITFGSGNQLTYTTIVSS